MFAVATDELQVQLLHPSAVPPARTRAGDAGFDLRCLEGFSLAPGERAVIGTGVAIALPEGTCGLVVPRSGLAARHGLSVVNGPGLIDPSYRGEIRVVLVNLGDEAYAGEPGDRIAQLLLVPFVSPETRVVDELPASPDGRGTGGFGSSGRSLAVAVAAVAVVALRHDRGEPRGDADALGGVLALEVAGHVVEL
jgi:dUTP pyrophosphatase